MSKKIRFTCQDSISKEVIGIFVGKNARHVAQTAFTAFLRNEPNKLTTTIEVIECKKKISRFFECKRKCTTFSQY